MRNSTNSRKSTGPKSARGKAVVSQNARKHGATSNPDPRSVAGWLRIILDAPDLELSDVLDDGLREYAALKLAEAEVRMCSAQAALNAFEPVDAPHSQSVQGLQSSAGDIIEVLREEITTVEVHQSGLSILSRIEKSMNSRTAQDGKRHLLLQRYVREARAQHKRAFQAWLVCLS